MNCGCSQEAGCYADFTMPSAPDPTQTATVNSIYYATPSDRPKSHNRGRPARAGVTDPRGFLLVQGPLGLNWRRRKWGCLPAHRERRPDPAQPAHAQPAPALAGAGYPRRGPPGVDFCEAPHPRGHPAQHGDAARASRCSSFHRALPQFAADAPRFPFPLRHGARTGEHRPCRGGRPNRQPGRLPRLPLYLAASSACPVNPRLLSSRTSSRRRPSLTGGWTMRRCCMRSRRISRSVCSRRGRCCPGRGKRFAARPEDAALQPRWVRSRLPAEDRQPGEPSSHGRLVAA